MADQLSLFAWSAIATPPMESDPARGVWFWCATEDGEDIDYSSHPHPLLPFFYPEPYGWYSSAPMPASMLEPEALARVRRLYAIPALLPKRRGGAHAEVR